MTSVNENNIIHSVLYRVTLAFSSFLIIFSAILIYILIFKISKKTPESKIMLILTIVELELSISKIAISIYKFAYGSTFLDKDTLLCSLSSFDYQLFIRIELDIVSVLAIMRYLIVCHRIEKSFVFWLAVTVVVCAPASFVYTYAAILKDATPSPSKIACYPYMNPGYLSKIMNYIIPFLFLIPSWTITYCYFAIGLRVRRKLNQMRSEAQNMNDVQSLIALKRQKIKIIIQLIAVVIIYNLNFSIAYITWILKFVIGYNRPPILEALSGILIFFTLTVNPLLAITFQPELNHELVSMLFYIGLKIKMLFKRFF